MSPRTITIDQRLYEYLLSCEPPEPAPLARLREETQATLGRAAGMQIGPDQARFMGVLLRLVGAKRVLEIGAFTGYSALAMALALPDDGRILTCDVSDEYTKVARRHWDAAGVGDRIELRLGPAVATLDDLLAHGREGEFDVAFIDADKGGYEDYWERCVRLVRRGGAILVDNVLWSGRVADESDQTPDTVALRRFNGKVRDDARVAMAMVGVGDGLTVAVVL